MAEQNIQVLGLCRWSYPSNLEAFATEFADMEALRAHLYAPARMELRLIFLEHLILPSLRGQTDRDFTLLLMIGDQLPAEYRTRLEVLIADVPQVRIVALAEGQNHRDACREVMHAHRDKTADAVAEFRLDDDDAVAWNFVAETRRAFDFLHPAMAETGTVALDFCKGIVIAAEAEGLAYYPVVQRLWTPGLVMFRRPHAKGSLLEIGHLRLWRSMPVLSMPKDMMFIRGAHDSNDSGLSAKRLQGALFQYDLMRLPADIKNKFGVDLEALDHHWMAHLSKWRPES